VLLALYQAGRPIPANSARVPGALTPREEWYLRMRFTAILRFIKSVESNKFDAALIAQVPGSSDDGIPF
jgi:hypothetical protein